MKIQWLNEGKTEALLTRGWFFVKQAKVIAKKTGFTDLSLEWYYAEDPSIRLDKKREQKIYWKIIWEEHLAEMKLRKKTARKMWHAPEPEDSPDYCKSIYG